MTDWYKAIPLATTKAVVDVDVEAEEVYEGTVVEAPAVVAGGASQAGAFKMSPPPAEDEGGEGPKAVKTATMARSPVFVMETFWLMVKQRRTTLLPQRRPKRAWLPALPPLLLGPEKQMHQQHHFAHCQPPVGKSTGDSDPPS